MDTRTLIILAAIPVIPPALNALSKLLAELRQWRKR